MNNEKWNNVLIEWVNCLKLSKNINDIEELRGGEFLSNLQKVITKSHNAQLDILTFIFDLFGKHYPNYSFENNTEIHLSDVPEMELKALTSLLMHYTCIYDRKDVLTSPLCHSLSQSTQLIIRKFLQKVTKEVTSVTMDDIIKSCIDDASDHLINNHWLSVDTSCVKNSPLQDLLKTPISKIGGRLHEKDRLISSLKTELEVERLDKAELQEDLKKHVEKNKKVEQQILQKNNEILRLRAEVLALENRTPPHYQDMDSRELQRRLRSEIQSLEQYIKQIEDEQEEITKEKDAAKEQLRKLETQSRIWEEKFFETERNFEVLKDHSKQKEDELSALQAYCAEITAMLDEYRSKPDLDSSLYDTFLSVSHGKSVIEPAACEDLACSVVEVQLRDAQKLNEELKRLIQEGEEREAKLKQAVEEVQEERERAEGRSVQLSLKVQNLETSEETLQKRLQNMEKALQESEHRTQKKQFEVNDLVTKLEEASETLSKLNDDNKGLQLTVTSWESRHEDLNNQLLQALTNLETEKSRSQDLENDRNNSKTISEKLQFELADVVLNNQKLTLQLDDLKASNDELFAKLEDAEATRGLLESHLLDSRRTSDSLKSELGRLHFEYSALKSELRESRSEFDQEKSELMSSLHESNLKLELLEKANEELKSNISNLHNQLTETLDRVKSGRNEVERLEGTRGLLERELGEVQTKVETLKVQFVESQKNNEELIAMLEEKKSQLDGVEQEKKSLEARMKEAEQAQVVLVLKNEELLQDSDILQEKLHKVETTLEERGHEMEKLLEKLCLTESCLKQKEEEVQEQQGHNQKLSQALRDTESLLQAAQDSGNLLQNEKEKLNLILQDSKKEIANLQLEIQTSKNVIQDLERCLAETELLREEVEHLNLDKKEMSEEIGVIRDQLQRTNDEKTMLNSQLDDSATHIQRLQQEVVTLKSELNTSENCLQMRDTEIKDLKGMKMSLETKLKKVTEIGEDLTSELEKVHLENTTVTDKLQKRVVTLEEERHHLMKKVGELEEDHALLLLDKKKTDEELSEVKNTLAIKLRDLEDVKNGLQAHINESNDLKAELLKIENQYKESRDRCEALEVAILNLETQLQSAEEQKCQINNLNEELENMRLHCLDLDKENNALGVQLQTALLKGAEQSSIIDNLQRQLAEDRKIITDGKNAEEALKQRILDLCAAVDEAHQDEQNTHENLMNVKNQNQILISKVEDYEVKCFRLEQKVTEVINNLILSNEESEEIRKKLENEKVYLTTKVMALEGMLQGVEAKNDSLINQRSELEKHQVICDSLIKEYEAGKNAADELMAHREVIQKGLEKENDLLRATLSDLEVKLKDSERNKYDLEQRLADLNETNEQNLAQREALERELSHLKDFSDSLQASNQLQNTTLKEEITLLTSVRDQKELELQANQLIIKKLEDTISDSKKLNAELQNQLAFLETDHKQLKANKEVTERQLNEVSVLSETLKMEAEEVRVQYQKSKKELNETREALVRITDQKAEVELQLNEARKEKDEVHANLVALQIELQEVAAKVDQEKSKNEELENRNGEDNKDIVELKAALESTKLRAETAEEQLESHRNQIVTLTEKLERLVDEKTVLDKKIEVEEIICSENRERAKSLEDTIQDYEITISGLKKVVDTNFEKLESFKEEVSERRNQELEIRNTINKLLKDNNVDLDPSCEDFKAFVFAHFSKVLLAKNEDAKRLVDMDNQMKELKNRNVSAVDLNTTFSEMIEKLHSLVTEKTDGTVATLKSRFDDVHVKVNNLLKSKEQLSEDLQRAEIEKSDLNRQVETLCKEKNELEGTLKEERNKIVTLQKDLETRTKPVKVEKENILSVSTKSNKSREDELKKENMMLKRKVVLTENAKSNLEKVLKELREEKKKVAVAPTSPDALYKKLLHEYIQVKEESEQALKEKNAKIEELTRQNQELQSVPVKTEDDKKLHNIREAYGNLMSVNSKLELEMVTLRKIIEERNTEVANMSHIKEAYEKLLEENNKMITEVDTLKYKRMRDKEEFVRLLKKERDSTDNREMKKIQDIRNEYEGKLEKMKEKMLKLYREEVNKKVKSMKDGQNETASLIKTVGNLRSDLFEAEQKIQLLEMEREMLRANRNLDREVRTVQMQSTSSVTSIVTQPERSATFPRPSISKELTISQRTSIGTIPNLPMEDEDDLFNDKYLADLKEGKCIQDRNSTARYSELAWRNSMVPPHLKSSYPAETQFVSPSRFKEDDIKSGHLELEDSLCKLLPGEKPRKKDFGTTSYKRPGPPTPSKNGGRLSLQGNEVHPMREHCETKTPKRSTPSRIKALFTGRNSSSMKDGSESNSNATPSRGKRLNIFRRPR